MTIFHWPDAVKLIEAATLAPGDWSRTLSDGTECRCMMGAMLPGAQSLEAFEAAGWPGWFVHLCTDLFDADAGRGQEIEADARRQFALEMAGLLKTHRDMDLAHDFFLLGLLSRPDHYIPLRSQSVAESEHQSDWWLACESAVRDVEDLLWRRIHGQDVAEEMAVAGEAARRASRGAISAQGDKRKRYVCSHASTAALFATGDIISHPDASVRYAAMAARFAFGTPEGAFKCTARGLLVGAMMGAISLRGGVSA